MFIMIFFGIALVVGIFFLFRGSWGSMGRFGPGYIQGDSPLDVLKKRYARGEINKEEFEQKKKDLGY